VKPPDFDNFATHLIQIQMKIQSIDSAVEKFNLLNHPFYRAWSAGSLPASALELYAWEYRKFIGKVAEGWDACGDGKIAEEERYHYTLWTQFAESLSEEDANTDVQEVNDLVTACENSFESYPTALGALYAFEVQQPWTSKSKLEGIRTHYASLNADEVYFDVHVDDFAEPALLREKMEALSEDDQSKAVDACDEVCEKLWNALTGIMHASGLHAEC
jgi:pyrroloquinoline-quinone synthase